MEIVIPIKLDLNYTVTGTDASQYPAWALHSSYPRGTRVFNNGNDYEALVDIPDALYAPSSSYAIAKTQWSQIAAAPGEVKTYDANVTVSDYPDWVSNTFQAVTSRVFDWRTNHDYQCLVETAAGSNTTPPSLCVVSSDATAAARFYDLGPSRLFQMLDGETEARTKSDENLPTIEATLTASGYSDTLMLAGMWETATVTVSIEPGQMIANADFSAANTSGWIPLANTTLTHSSGMRLTHVATIGDTLKGWARYIVRTVPGKSYSFTAAVDTGPNSLSMRLSAYAADGLGAAIASSTTRTTDGALTLSFTATEERQIIAVEVLTGTAGQYCAVAEVSCKQTGFTNVSNAVIDLGYEQGDIYRRIYKYSHEDCSNPQYTLVFTAPQTFRRPEVGLIACGRAYYIGATEAELEVGIQDYSLKKRDDTYGTTTFYKRGYSRQYKAKIWLPGDAGDFVAAGLSARRAEPIFFDCNNETTNFARLMTYGYARDWYITTTGLPDIDYLSIDIEGLIE